MKRTLLISVAVVVVSLFIGSALKVQAATTSAPAAQVSNASADSGYWAAWADAASH